MDARPSQSASGGADPASADPAWPWLAADLEEVPGIGARTAAALRRHLGVRAVRDLLEHYPYRGRYREVGPVASSQQTGVGQSVTIVGTIESWQTFDTRRSNLKLSKATLVEDGGSVVDVTFFNQRWRPRRHPPGTRVAVSGTLDEFRGRPQLKNPSLAELDGDEQPPDTRAAHPTYPATEALPTHRIAAAVNAVLDVLPPLPEHLPEELRARYGLPTLDGAVRGIHRPRDAAEAERARHRLVYDELLCLQLGLQQRRARLEAETRGLEQQPQRGGWADALLEALPFPPTNAQWLAFAELAGDLGSVKPMHRLLQGDVGSGKTLVAAWAMLTALDHGRQAALMAPTEVLAEQHLRTLDDLLAPLGVNLLVGPRVGLLTGSQSSRRRREVLAELHSGELDLVVGTHALLEPGVWFADLGVVVVDEQHRFGVEHRMRLRDKRVDEHAPDVLVMTATPIPRSLALTFYGDLDLAILDELPPGRQPIRTEVIHTASSRRKKLEAFVRERVSAGERCYVVCPLVEPSEALDGVKSATDEYRRLVEGPFADLDVGLLHGQLPTAEKDAVMDAFRAGDVQVLVATSVIEVGLDVPAATIMIIEDAHRFGLSQLHQLRGRVGRGGAQSWCVLMSEEADDNPRLRALASTRDGFELAETDLELRGEGSLFDTRQSGLPDLTIARLDTDRDVVRHARDDARLLAADDPTLERHPRLAAEVRRRYGDDALDALESG
ncbi:ATP-dependent DNA helicase RecG [Egibacter rhizosphaerae]|uniref:ATP-dependent DNA helicase RecG n=1 Tax=Egibacter rhizosphaerae TaxID=1670831 RepID=UPI0013F175B5|nr:ATP-dependent DNA helicase RecG [Egibacter rhizosphaerae]